MSDAEKETMDRFRKLLPSDRCVLCGRTLEQVGGKRMVGSKSRGICLSTKFQGGGNADYPFQSVKLDETAGIYLMVWGEKDKWTSEAIERAKTAYLNARRPWFCQVCGARTCRECGAPINLPMGSDVLYDNGCSSHVTMFPFDPGCINPACKRYREWGETARNKKRNLRADG